MTSNKKVMIMNHPLIQHKLTLLRNKNTSYKEFRELISEVTMLMCYESMRDLALEEVEIETPLETSKFNALVEKRLIFVPILRAGLGMTEGVMKMLPTARIGHLGFYRDHETLKPVEYYSKLPSQTENEEIVILDPMLATGGTAIDGINMVKRRNPKSIKFMCILASPQGIENLSNAHPDVSVYCGACDRDTNEHGYILPGLGDAGDRIFGTD